MCYEKAQDMAYPLRLPMHKRTSKSTSNPIPVCEGALLQHLFWEGTFDIHDQLEHFIVCLAREQDLASEQLVDDTTHTPDVQRVVCTHPSTFTAVTMQHHHGQVFMHAIGRNCMLRLSGHNAL